MALPLVVEIVYPPVVKVSELAVTGTVTTTFPVLVPKTAVDGDGVIDRDRAWCWPLQTSWGGGVPMPLPPWAEAALVLPPLQKYCVLAPDGADAKRDIADAIAAVDVAGPLIDQER